MAAPSHNQQYDVTGAPVHDPNAPAQYQAAPAQQHGAPAQHAVAPTHQNSAMQGDMDRWKEKFNNTANSRSQPPGNAPWSASFWACCTPADLCCMTCCCPCITFGKTHHRLENNGDMSHYSAVNFSCVAWWATACVGISWLGNMVQRNDIRARSSPKLEGEVVGDCLRAFCCTCCDLMQQDKEAQALLARNPTVNQQPPQAGGMHYGAPATQ